MTGGTPYFLDTMGNYEGDQLSGAVFSKDRAYRYALWRFRCPGPYVLFLGINPSNAGAAENDHTVTKLIEYTKLWGYAGFCILNPFAYISTDQRGLLKADDPVGSQNDRYLQNAVQHAACVVCCWGSGKNVAVRRLLVTRLEEMQHILATRELWCFGVAKSGYPKHPLMLPYRESLVPWEPNG